MNKKAREIIPSPSPHTVLSSPTVTQNFVNFSSSNHQKLTQNHTSTQKSPLHTRNSPRNHLLQKSHNHHVSILILIPHTSKNTFFTPARGAGSFRKSPGPSPCCHVPAPGTLPTAPRWSCARRASAAARCRWSTPSASCRLRDAQCTR